MPVTNWNTTTINGQQFLVIDVASFRIPLNWDPSSNMFLAVAAPSGGLGNFPALVQGNPGTPAAIDTAITLTPLASTDPTAASATWTNIGSNTYHLNLSLHEGAPGASGTTTVNLSAYGTPAAGQILVVDPSATTLVYQSQKVGDRFVPASILSAPSGNVTYTVCSVSIAAQPNSWRPDVRGQTLITYTGPNCQANLVARLGNATTGAIVGQGFGTGTPTDVDAVILSSAPPPGSATGYDLVAAGASAVIYLNVERQSGTDTFTTSSTTTNFAARVQPTP